MRPQILKPGAATGKGFRVGKYGILFRDLWIFWSSWYFFLFLFLKVNLGSFGDFIDQ